MSAGVRLWGVLDEALENHLPAPEGVVGADGDEIPLMIQGRVWTEAPPDEKKIRHNALKKGQVTVRAPL